MGSVYAKQETVGCLDKLMRIVLCIPAVSLAIIWFAHVAHTEFGDPLGLPFDEMLWRNACLLKLLTLAAMVELMRRSYATLHGNRRHAIRVALFGSLSMIVLLISASLSREWWAPMLTNDSVKYYTLSGDHSTYGFHWTYWSWCWSLGIVTVAESLVCVGIIVGNAWLGYRWGFIHGMFVTGIMFSVIAAVLFAILTGWTLIDYDNFHGDIVTSSVLADGITPIRASDPYTTIGAAVYLTITLVLFYASSGSPNHDTALEFEWLAVGSMFDRQSGRD